MKRVGSSEVRHMSEFDAVMAAFGLQDYPGWVGMHTRNQARGAIPNGARVRKISTERGDSHPVGSTATVLGSIFHASVGYGYFVEWDVSPRSAVFVVGEKIAPDASEGRFQ